MHRVTNDKCNYHRSIRRRPGPHILANLRSRYLAIY